MKRCILVAFFVAFVCSLQASYHAGGDDPRFMVLRASSSRASSADVGPEPPSEKSTTPIKKTDDDVRSPLMKEALSSRWSFPCDCPLCGHVIERYEEAISCNELCEKAFKEEMFFHIYCALQCLIVPYKTLLSTLLEDHDWPRMNLCEVSKKLVARHADVDFDIILQIVDVMLDQNIDHRLRRRIRAKREELRHGLVGED